MSLETEPTSAANSNSLFVSGWPSRLGAMTSFQFSMTTRMWPEGPYAMARWQTVQMQAAHRPATFVLPNFMGVPLNLRTLAEHDLNPHSYVAHPWRTFRMTWVLPSRL